MAAEPSWEDIFKPQPDSQLVDVGADAVTTEPAGAFFLAGEDAGASGGATRRELRQAQARGPRRPRQPPKRNFTWLWALVIVFVLLAGGGTLAWVGFERQIRSVLGWSDPTDYVGNGTGSVEVVIKNGDSGRAIAGTLANAGVIKTSDVFYRLVLAQTTSPTFHPGTFRLAKGMSAKSALAALLDPANHVVDKIAIPEGTTVAGVLQRINTATGIPLADLQAAAADYKSFGLPEAAPSLEGYLFPATYRFDPEASPHDILSQMVSEMFSHLDKAGVAPADRHRVLTMAGLVQKEGGSDEDFLKVSRVFANRLAIGMDLQSDAAVSYGAGSTTIATTNAQRADASNPYNTYVHPGLPIGPISNPGDAAINAALHPVDGPWLYFVLVNGETGETVFSTTLAEHDAAVKRWQAWYRAHPDYDK